MQNWDSKLNPKLILLLEQLQQFYNLPAYIYSGVQNKEINMIRGDSPLHISGDAIDFAIPGIRMIDVFSKIQHLKEYNVVLKRTFLHVEVNIGRAAL